MSCSSDKSFPLKICTSCGSIKHCKLSPTVLGFSNISVTKNDPLYYSCDAEACLLQIKVKSLKCNLLYSKGNKNVFDTERHLAASSHVL